MTTTTTSKRRGRPAKNQATKGKMAKKVATETTTRRKPVTFTGSTAERFIEAKTSLNESGRIPFEVSNSQFMSMLMDNYDRSSGSF